MAKNIEVWKPRGAKLTVGEKTVIAKWLVAKGILVRDPGCTIAFPPKELEKQQVRERTE